MSSCVPFFLSGPLEVTITSSSVHVRAYGWPHGSLVLAPGSRYFSCTSWLMLGQVVSLLVVCQFWTAPRIVCAPVPASLICDSR